MFVLILNDIREIIIMAFECPHCGFRNNELQSAGVVNERGHTITLSIQNKEVNKKKNEKGGDELTPQRT